MNEKAELKGKLQHIGRIRKRERENESREERRSDLGADGLGETSEKVRR